MSKPMKSAAQLSLVVTSYMARLHGNDDISGIGKNASSPIDSLDLGVPSIARCPLPVALVPSMDDVGCIAALVEVWLWRSPPLLLRFHPPGSLPSPTAASVPTPRTDMQKSTHWLGQAVQVCLPAVGRMQLCPNGHFSGLARFVGPINLCLLKRERGGGAWEAHGQTSRIGQRGRCQPTRT